MTLQARFALSSAIFLTCAVAAGCGENEFKSGGAKARNAAPEASSNDLDKGSASKPTESSEGTVTQPLNNASDGKEQTKKDKVDAGTVLTGSDDKKSLLECVKKWGLSDFTDAQLRSFKTMESNSLGIGTDQLVDSKHTDEPRLVLIKIRSNGLTTTDLQLLNPNGFYCIHSERLGISTLNVTRTCQAEVTSDDDSTNGLTSKNQHVIDCPGAADG